MDKLILSWIIALLFSCGTFISAQIHFSPPDHTPYGELTYRSESRGIDLMEAFTSRRSCDLFQDKEISLQDLADLLWCAYGQNRPEGKLTAPTAMNSQDVNVYICLSQWVWKYLPDIHALEFISREDIRPLFEGGTPARSPAVIILTADMKKYKSYHSDAENSRLYEMGAIDCGIVSQNISLFCAAAGLGTKVRAWMDHDALRRALMLEVEEIIWLNMPVGYPSGQID